MKHTGAIGVGVRENLYGPESPDSDHPPQKNLTVPCPKKNFMKPNADHPRSAFQVQVCFLSYLAPPHKILYPPLVAATNHGNNCNDRFGGRL